MLVSELQENAASSEEDICRLDTLIGQQKDDIARLKAEAEVQHTTMESLREEARTVQQQHSEIIKSLRSEKDTVSNQLVGVKEELRLKTAAQEERSSRSVCLRFLRRKHANRELTLLAPFRYLSCRYIDVTEEVEGARLSAAEKIVELETKVAEGEEKLE